MKFRIVSGGIADKQVGSNRGIEQVRLLLAAADDGPDVGRAQGLDVDAVDADTSLLEVEKSQQDGEQGALAGTARAGHHNPFAAANF